MDLGIKNKKAVVLAGSSGFGLEAAKTFYSEGCDLIICSRNEEHISHALSELKRLGNGALHGFSCDVADKKSLGRFWDQVFEEFTNVDILVTNAGGPPAKYFEEVIENEWYDAIELNLMSVIRSINRVLPGMKQQKWGRIVNITSVTVKMPKPELVLSNVVRSGVVSLGRTLATEYGEYNILINNIAPGFHKTPALDRVIRKNAQMSGKGEAEIIAGMSQQIPLKRIGGADEMAGLIAFLCSAKNSYMTGQTLVHDGGFVKTI